MALRVVMVPCCSVGDNKRLLYEAIAVGICWLLVLVIAFGYVGHRSLQSTAISHNLSTTIL